MTNITIAKGDGIGPEIMDATLKIIMAAGADIAIDEIEWAKKFTWQVTLQVLPKNPGILSAGIRFF